MTIFKTIFLFLLLSSTSHAVIGDAGAVWAQVPYLYRILAENIKRHSIGPSYRKLFFGIGIIAHSGSMANNFGLTNSQIVSQGLTLIWGHLKYAE